jgi:hypothetical protein
MTNFFANSLQALVETPPVAPSGPPRRSMTSAPAEFRAELKAHLAKQDPREQDDFAPMTDGSVSPAPRRVSEADARASTSGSGSLGTASPPRTETQPSGSSKTVQHEARTEQLPRDRIPDGGKGRPTSQASSGACEPDAQASQRLSSKDEAVVSEAKTGLIPELTSTDAAKTRAIPIGPTVIGQVTHGKQIVAKFASMNPAMPEETPGTSANPESSGAVEKANKGETSPRQGRTEPDALSVRETDSLPLKSQSTSSQEAATPSEKHGDVIPEIHAAGKRVISDSQDRLLTNLSAKLQDQPAQPSPQRTKQSHSQIHTSDRSIRADISEMGPVRFETQKGQSSGKVATELNAGGRIVNSLTPWIDVFFSDTTAGSASRSIARDVTAPILSESSSPKVTDSRESLHGLSGNTKQETPSSEEAVADAGQESSDRDHSSSWSKHPMPTREWAVQNPESYLQPLLQSRLSLKAEQINELRALVERVLRSSQPLRLDNGSGLRFSWISKEWGPIRFTIGLLEQRIVARIQVPNLEVRTLLEGHRDLLRQVFAEQGLRLDQFEVESATDVKPVPIPEVRWDGPRRRRGRWETPLEPPGLQLDEDRRVEKVLLRERQAAGHVWIA